jgi:CBS domain-containing protein
VRPGKIGGWVGLCMSAQATESMSDPLLVRDVMRIGVPTCKETDPLDKVAALMLDQAATALVVLDEEADTRGWINEARLAQAYLLAASLAPDTSPLLAAAQLMADSGADHVFSLHRAGGHTWPASVLSLHDLVRALAGPEYIKNQGTAAPRPTPMDLFRQRYGLPDRR